MLGHAAGRLDAAQRRALGLAFVPEERLGRGAVPEMSLADNALLTAHREGMVKRGFVRATPWCARSLRDTIRAYGVKAGGPDADRAQPVRRQPAEVHRRPRNPPAAET